MDEFLRHIWLHGTEAAASEWLVYTILILMALGSILRSRIITQRDAEGLMAAAVVMLTSMVLLLLSAFLPESPLLGVTGGLFPSPWSHGIVQCVCIGCVVVCATFGLVAGTIHSWRDALQLITYGISRWPWVILLIMLLTFMADILQSFPHT